MNYHNFTILLLFAGIFIPLSATQKATRASAELQESSPRLSAEFFPPDDLPKIEKKGLFGRLKEARANKSTPDSSGSAGGSEGDSDSSTKSNSTRSNSGRPPRAEKSGSDPDSPKPRGESFGRTAARNIVDFMANRQSPPLVAAEGEPTPHLKRTSSSGATRQPSPPVDEPIPSPLPRSPSTKDLTKVVAAASTDQPSPDIFSSRARRILHSLTSPRPHSPQVAESAPLDLDAEIVTAPHIIKIPSVLAKMQRLVSSFDGGNNIVRDGIGNAREKYKHIMTKQESEALSQLEAIDDQYYFAVTELHKWEDSKKYLDDAETQQKYAALQDIIAAMESGYENLIPQLEDRLKIAIASDPAPLAHSQRRGSHGLATLGTLAEQQGPI